MSVSRISPELIDRYDLSGPRYTSYPTVPQWQSPFAEVELLNALGQSARQRRPLSLYLHLPFCQSLCYYCGCNKVVTHNRSRVTAYLVRLEQEMADYSALVAGPKIVRQLHWGGGTPSYLNLDEMRLLMQMTRRHFALANDDSGEYSIEIHPGQTESGSLRALRAMGFNRVSMGVQDFDERVQQAVNRHNTVAQIQALMAAIAESGFHSVNMDLIYGLPLQTPESFAHTLERVIELAPDRISLFNYAHMPELFKSQRLIKTEQLPSAGQKLAIFSQALRRLAEAGYCHIGMDHFARVTDSLAVAQREGRLHRNFQGYTTHAECDQLGFGVSAISCVGNVYWQNSKRLDTYQRCLDEGRLPVERGLTLSGEDCVRRWAINQLICHYRLDFNALQGRHGVEPMEYFGAELQALQPLADDGLVRLHNRGIEVTEAGKLLIRRICMVFDAYLQTGQVQYSKVI